MCALFLHKKGYISFFSNAKPRKKYFIRMHAVWNMCQRLRSNNEMHILWLNLAQHSNLNEKSIDMNCNTLALYDMWLPYICVVRKNLEIYQAHSKKLWNSGALRISSKKKLWKQNLDWKFEIVSISWSYLHSKVLYTCFWNEFYCYNRLHYSSRD